MEFFYPAINLHSEIQEYMWYYDNEVLLCSYWQGNASFFVVERD